MEPITIDFNNLTEEQKTIIVNYYSDGMSKLKKLCAHKIRERCSDSNVDEDDLYDIASFTLLSILDQYDENRECKFETFLLSSICKKIDTYTRNTKYRYKRSNVRKDKQGKMVHVPNVSIDKLNNDGIEFVEKLDSGYRIEDDLSCEIGYLSDDKWGRYLARLSIKQRKIAIFLSEGYKPFEIRKLLHITKKDYADDMIAIKSYNNLAILI